MTIMRLLPLPYTAVAAATTLTGFIVGLINKSTKLYFAGDGGGTDFQIVFKYMFAAAVISGIIFFIITYPKIITKNRKATIKLGISIFLVGVTTTIIAGAIITRVFEHTACDEYGRQSGVCQDRPSSWFY